MSKRLSGTEVNKVILKKSKGNIWMKNPTLYKGMQHKQWFIDNRFGESLPFFSQVASVYHRGSGARAYQGRSLSLAKTWMTKSYVLKLAKKFKFRSDFQKAYPSVYQTAFKKKWLTEACNHMSQKGNRVRRFIYGIIHSRNKEIYVGLSYNPEVRFLSHKKQGKPYVKKLIRSGGKLKVLTDLLEVSKASKEEQRLVQKYLESGWNVINMSKAGTIGGSNRRYYKADILRLVKGCKTRTEFFQKCRGAYMAAKKLNIFEEVVGHLHQQKVYTLREIREAVQKCSSRTEFSSKYPGESQAARRKGWYEKVVSSMPKDVRYTADGRKTGKAFISLNIETEEVLIWLNQRECAQHLKVSPKNLNLVLSGARKGIGTEGKKHPTKGYIFEYV